MVEGETIQWQYSYGVPRSGCPGPHVLADQTERDGSALQPRQTELWSYEKGPEEEGEASKAAQGTAFRMLGVSLVPGLFVLCG